MINVDKKEKKTHQTHNLIETFKTGYKSLIVTRLKLIPSGQHGRHFTDGTFRYIFVNEKCFILIKISLKFVLKGPIDNKPGLVKKNGLAPNRRQAII